MDNKIRIATKKLLIKYARKAVKNDVWEWEDIAEEIREKNLDYEYYERFFRFQSLSGDIGYDWVNGNERWRLLKSLVRNKIPARKIIKII